MIGDIRKFRFWCQKVLPLVYDDSLSYYEVLCKVVQYLNKVIEDVNSIPSYIDAVIDEKLSDEHLRELIEQFVLDIEAAISSNNEGDNTNSSADYNIGEMLWWKGKLYKVIRSINEGDTLIVGTNIQLTNFETLFNDFLNEIKYDITSNDDGTNTTASRNWTAGQWLWLNDNLYIVTRDITQGNAYVFEGENSNVEQISIEAEFIKETEARENADADINSKIGNLEDLVTTDRDNLVDAINETASSIGKTSKLINNKLIFVKNVADPAMVNGNCQILKTDNTVTMFDLSYAHNEQNIIDSLNKHDIKHIDNVVISHYHEDHASLYNLTSFINNGFINADTKFYLARAPFTASCWTSGLNDIYNDFINAIVSLGADYTTPNSGDSIAVDECVVTFFNNDVEDQNWLSGVTNDYNDFSMGSYIETSDLRFCLFADANKYAEQRAYDTGYALKSNIETANHHTVASYYADFELNVKAELAVGMTSNKYINRDGSLTDLQTAFLTCAGTKIITTSKDEVVVSFNDYNYVISEYENSYKVSSNYRTVVTLHVDATNYNDIENGAVNHPFETLGKALGYAKQFKGCDVIIDASNYTDNNNYVLSGYACKLTLLGCTIKSIGLYNGDYELNGCTITANDRVAVTATLSRVTIVNCTIAGDTTALSNATGAAIIASTNSKIYVDSLTASNKKSCFRAANNGEISCNSLAGTNNVYIADATDIYSVITVNTITATATNRITNSLYSCYKGNILAEFNLDSALTAGTLKAIVKDNVVQYKGDATGLSITASETNFGTITDATLRPTMSTYFAGFVQIGSARHPATIRLNTAGVLTLFYDSTLGTVTGVYFAGTCIIG